jgi:hypothetical protein
MVSCGEWDHMISCQVSGLILLKVDLLTLGCQICIGGIT